MKNRKKFLYHSRLRRIAIPMIFMFTLSIISISLNANNLNHDLLYEIDQQQTIKGVVVDQQNSPLPGVTIVLKGTTIGTVSNENGEYSLSNIPQNSTIVFSFVGMVTQEVYVGNESVINVVMQEETIGLDEFVAIGYGTVRKSDLTVP